MPMSSDEKRAVQTAWRVKHRSENGRRDRAYPASRNEARALLETGDGGTMLLSPACA